MHSPGNMNSYECVPEEAAVWYCSIVGIWLLMCNLELYIIRVLTFYDGREGE